MKYLLLIYSTGDRLKDMTPERRAADGEAHGAFGEYLAGQGIPFSWTVLQDQSATTTIAPAEGDGHLVTDGPFVTLKEFLGGYYVIETADRDQAVEAAKHCPSEFVVEVRPVAFASS